MIVLCDLPAALAGALRIAPNGYAVHHNEINAGGWQFRIVIGCTIDDVLRVKDDNIGEAIGTQQPATGEPETLSRPTGHGQE